MQLHSAPQQYSIGLYQAQAKAPNQRVHLPGSTTDGSSADAGPESTDPVTISSEGQEKAATASEKNTTETTPTGKELSKEELAALTKLQKRDKEVRAHEQAHMAAAGKYSTGGPSFTYQKGPDGNSYAIGGEVGVDMSKESDPNATIQKMRAVKRAALAPASPSSVDRQVAAQASVKESQARKELAQEQEEMLEAAATEDSSTPGESATQSPESNSSPSPSVSALRAIAAYEQISAM